MSQALSYNGYTFDEDSCSFKIGRQGIVGGTGRLNYVRNVWTISGRCNGLNISQVDTKVVQIENAIRDGGDLVFSLGTTMSLISSQCVQGTHVKHFGWERGYDGVHGNGAEGVLRRTFSLIVYGDILVTTDTDITSWRETITQIGFGGPRIVPVSSLAGTVQPQQIEAATPIWLTQTGYATGLRDHPAAPTPVYEGLALAGLAFYTPEGLSVTAVTPTNFGVNRNTNFGTRWNYRCWTANGASQPGGMTLSLPSLPTPSLF